MFSNTETAILKPASRYKPSQVYFARSRVKGKLIRRSLKTNHIGVAKLRLANLEKNEQQKARSVNAVSSGKTTFGDALAAFKSRIPPSSLVPRSFPVSNFRPSEIMAGAGAERRELDFQCGMFGLERGEGQSEQFALAQLHCQYYPPGATDAAVFAS